MAKKVCILTGIFPPEVGGPATFAEHFSEFAATAGAKVRILTYCNGKSHHISQNNIEVRQISRTLPLPFRYFRMSLEIAKSYSLGYKLIANGCFLEIGFIRFLFPISYVVKIPGDIVWERAKNNGETTSDIDVFQEENLRLGLRIMKSVFQFSIIRAGRVIVPSKHLYTLAIQWGAKPGKVEIIHNSISLTDFPFLRQGSYDFDLVSVTRLVKWKGLKEVIEAAAQLGLSLGLVGVGPEEMNLRRLSRTVGAQVTFLGSIGQRELSDIYSRSKFFVLNSNFEATSYALLEARATGLVSIANLNTGSQEVIHHLEDGLLCGPELTILEAISMLKNNLVDVKEFELRARKDTEERFNQSKNFQSILDVILEEK